MGRKAAGQKTGKGKKKKKKDLELLPPKMGKVDTDQIPNQVCTCATLSI